MNKGGEKKKEGTRESKISNKEEGKKGEITQNLFIFARAKGEKKKSIFFGKRRRGGSRTLRKLANLTKRTAPGIPQAQKRKEEGMPPHPLERKGGGEKSPYKTQSWKVRERGGKGERERGEEEGFLLYLRNQVNMPKKGGKREGPYKFSITTSREGKRMDFLPQSKATKRSFSLQGGEKRGKKRRGGIPNDLHQFERKKFPRPPKKTGKRGKRKKSISRKLRRGAVSLLSMAGEEKEGALTNQVRKKKKKASSPSFILREGKKKEKNRHKGKALGHHRRVKKGKGGRGRKLIFFLGGEGKVRVVSQSEEKRIKKAAISKNLVKFARGGEKKGQRWERGCTIQGFKGGKEKKKLFLITSGKTQPVRAKGSH